MSNKKETELSKAMGILRKHLIKDKDYRYGWKANIAMAFYDEYSRCKNPYKNLTDIHSIANQAAVNFLNQLTKRQP